MRRRCTSAQQSSSIHAYTEFVSAFPKGRFTKTARAQLQTLEWTNAQRQGSVASYAEFLRKYPKAAKGRHISAKKQIERLETARARRVARQFSKDPVPELVKRVNAACKLLKEVTVNEPYRHWCRSTAWQGQGVFSYQQDSDDNRPPELKLKQRLLVPTIGKNSPKATFPQSIVKLRCAPSIRCGGFATFEFLDQFDARVVLELFKDLTQTYPANCPSVSKSQSLLSQTRKKIESEDERLSLAMEVDAENRGIPSRRPSAVARTRRMLLGKGKLYVTPAGKSALWHHRREQAYRRQDAAFLQHCLSK